MEVCSSDVDGAEPEYHRESPLEQMVQLGTQVLAASGTGYYLSFLVIKKQKTYHASASLSSSLSAVELPEK